MLLQFGVEIYGEELLAKAIKGVSERTANLAPYFDKQAAPDIYNATKLTFAAEGRPKWEALKPATVIQRANMGFPALHPILVRTGTLRSSVIKRGDPNNVLKIGRLEMQMYSNLKVGKYYLAELHQKGTNKMSARVEYKLIQQEWERITLNLVTYIHGERN